MPYPVNLISAGAGVPLEDDLRAVEAVKAALVAHGYEGKGSLRRFQHDHFLEVTGELDPETLDALGVEL